MAFINSVNASGQGVQYLSTGGTWTGLDASTVGFVLTSNGTGVSPSFQAAGGGGGITTLTGNGTGSATGATVDLTSMTTNGTERFIASGSTVTFSPTTFLDNTGYGANSMLAFGGGAFVSDAFGNTAFGSSSLRNITDTIAAGSNSAFGTGALQNLIDQGGNSAFGASALTSYTGVSGAGSNSAFGFSLRLLTTGSFNCAFGHNAGNAYTSTESSNILIGTSTFGTVGESNAMRLGSATGAGAGQINKTFIAGVTGIAPIGGNNPQVTLTDSNGQLSTIAGGTSGQILTSNGVGAAPSFQAATGAGRLVLIQTQTAAASPTIDFTTGITATYSSYMLIMTNVVASAASELRCVLSIDGGASYLATGYNGGRDVTIAGAASWVGGTSTTFIPIAGTLNAGTPGLSGTLNFYNLATAANPYMEGSLLMFSAGSAFRNLSTGNNTTTSAVNAIRFVLSAGTITSGKFSLFGILE